MGVLQQMMKPIRNCDIHYIETNPFECGSFRSRHGSKKEWDIDIDNSAQVQSILISIYYQSWESQNSFRLPSSLIKCIC